jgi:hypothetical protein
LGWYAREHYHNTKEKIEKKNKDEIVQKFKKFMSLKKQIKKRKSL